MATPSSNPYNRAYYNGRARSIAVTYSSWISSTTCPFPADPPAARNLGRLATLRHCDRRNRLPAHITLGGNQASNGLANGPTGRTSAETSLNHTALPGGSIHPRSRRRRWVSGATTPATPSTGPGRDNWNIALFKDFTLNEARGSRFEFRVESFNTFNHTQWNINTSFATPASLANRDPHVLQLHSNSVLKAPQGLYRQTVRVRPGHPRSGGTSGREL